MSNRNPDVGYDHVITALEFHFEQKIKELNTSLPGVVQSYDAHARRAKVLPAIRHLLTDGSTMSRAPLIDVPVLHPQGGGYIIHMPIVKGDAVMLIFSQRGLTAFKETLIESDPDRDAVMALKDAVAIAGFGGEKVDFGGDPPDGESLNEIYIQDVKGDVHIRLGKNISIKGDVTIEGTLKMEDNIIMANGKTVDGVDVGGHKHKYIPGDKPKVDTSTPT